MTGPLSVAIYIYISPHSIKTHYDIWSLFKSFALCEGSQLETCGFPSQTNSLWVAIAIYLNDCCWGVTRCWRAQKNHSSLFMINPCYHNTHLSRLFTGTKSCVTHYWMPDISTDHLFGYERTSFAVVLWLRLIHSFVENKTYTVETLCSTIYYSKYFIELNIDRSTLYVALWTHKRHPIPRPFGRDMECLLWVLQQKLIVL